MGRSGQLCRCGLFWRGQRRVSLPQGTYWTFGAPRTYSHQKTVLSKSADEVPDVGTYPRAGPSRML